MIALPIACFDFDWSGDASQPSVRCVDVEKGHSRARKENEEGSARRWVYHRLEYTALDAVYCCNSKLLATVVGYWLLL